MGSGVESYVSRRMKLRIMAGDIPKWMLGHSRSNYLIASYLSAPLWMHRSMLAPMRQEAVRRTQETGVRYSLDHITCVTHSDVCGLTVPWNIRVIPLVCNLSKGNKWHPDQMELSLIERAPLQLDLF